MPMFPKLIPACQVNLRQTVLYYKINYSDAVQGYSIKYAYVEYQCVKLKFWHNTMQ